ncbi:MAG: riboflavin synthase [Limnochordaceae bacterium]|nr:riboflavin synthase [Limnochordaceae bacterium]
MFTGIVEEMGQLAERRQQGPQAQLVIEAKRVLEGTQVGDSIAVNGVCLTVVEHDNHCFRADVTAETLRRSSLGQLQIGQPVNLERALTLQSRLGGHLVLGHVDGVGRVERLLPSGEGFRLEVSYPPELGRFIAEKGSIAVDGVSLTVAGLLEPQRFWVAIIPQTARVTIIGQYRVGQPVNLEVDVLARYVQRLLTGGGGGGDGGGSSTGRDDGDGSDGDDRAGGGGGLTLEKLAEHGFC